MANFLSSMKYNMDKARNELESALDVLESRSGGRATDMLQQLSVTNGMADVFKDKPVVIIQMMDVRILQVDNRINAALRALDKYEALRIRAREEKKSNVEKRG
jgi:hypothetical protein